MFRVHFKLLDISDVREDAFVVIQNSSKRSAILVSSLDPSRGKKRDVKL
jgi:hypothetical protein